MIVVTGGAGFIGSNLVAALEATGHHDVVVVDRLGQGDKWRNLAKRELHDLVDPGRFAAWLEGAAGRIEVMFHLGAISATTERDADLIVETNFRQSLALWAWCAAHGVRLVYASSAATYGDGAAGFVDDGSPQALARLRPLNAYGWSKHLFDRRVARAVAAGEPTPPQWAGLKFFNVYGPNERHKGDMMSLVAKLWPVVTAGQPARLFRSYRPEYEDGGQLRDFIHVDDAVAVMLWLLANPGVTGLYNVGSGLARSFRDLAIAVTKAARQPARIDYVEMPEVLRAKYQYFTQADRSRLVAAGFDRPPTSLEDGVAAYCRDFLAQPDPYR